MFCLMSGMVAEEESYNDKGIDKPREMLWEVTKLVSWVQVHGTVKLFSEANMYWQKL